MTDARQVLPDVLTDPAVAARLGAVRDHSGRILAYFVPIGYTMQGMIANTGEEWKLFARHTTRRMIKVLAVRETPPGSGWGAVPTPVF